MITPEGIRARVVKLWASGYWLRVWLRQEAVFPYAIPFRRPSAREWLDDFTKLRATVERLDAQSKSRHGSGYTVQWREVAHRSLGMQRIPERVVLESVEDAAACAGEVASFARFRDVADLIRASEPRLLEWLAARPMVALAREPALPRLLAVVRYVCEHPRPGVFVREFGVPGVDTKFVEAHKSVLRDWLDRLLPPAAIDAQADRLADHGFERRYGFRFEEPVVRFRWLDRARRLAPGITDAAVPLSQFAAYAPDCERVFVTENKVSFLTLPPVPGGLAIFGAGYAIEQLDALPWLERCPLYHWGDIDTHGFSILNRLRSRWPHTRSFLMDRDTLLAHQAHWSEEPADARHIGDLPALEPGEGALYRDLCTDALGVRVRLEQERIGFGWVTRAIDRMLEGG